MSDDQFFEYVFEEEIALPMWERFREAVLTFLDNTITSALMSPVASNVPTVLSALNGIKN